MKIAARRPKLLVVTPAKDEAVHLPAVISCMVAQSFRPDEWRIVDDASTDATSGIALAAAAAHGWIKLTKLGISHAELDGLAVGRPVRAFAAGVRDGFDDWDYLSKIDADVELPPDYFESVIARMEADDRLGMAGGVLIEPDPAGGHRPISVPRQHVPGALTVYRRACFVSIGGVREMLGWDTIDETMARMKGFRTQSFPDIVARHRRETGAVAGVVRGRARHGTVAWITHYPLYFVLLRAMKLTSVSPRGILALAFLWGYIAAALRRVPRIQDEGFRSHMRRELRERVFTWSREKHGERN